MAKSDPIWTLQRENALQEMGFKEDPFNITADPRFLYLSAQHGDVLRKTQNVIESSRGLACVEGPIGVGKSTIARRLESIYRGDPDQNVVVFIHSSKYQSEYAALLDISSQLGLERRKGLMPQWREMEKFLIEMAKIQKTVVFILDDAQKMEPDALELVHTLYNFDVNRKLAQVILFGQPEIQALFIKRPEVRHRVYAWHTLNNLSFAESLELIRFRCKVAGRDKPLISQNSYVAINNVANGIPRDIVLLLSNIVDEIARADKNPGDGLIADDIVAGICEIYEKKRQDHSTPQPTLFSEEA